MRMLRECAGKVYYDEKKKYMADIGSVFSSIDGKQNCFGREQKPNPLRYG